MSPLSSSLHKQIGGITSLIQELNLAVGQHMTEVPALEAALPRGAPMATSTLHTHLLDRMGHVMVYPSQLRQKNQIS